MSSTIFFLVIAILLLVMVLTLLRSRKLREKYAALWIVVSVVIVVLALFPDLLQVLASAVGVAVPSNLLFALAILLLLGVALHLSLEVSRHDDETRALSEEVAILRLQLYDVNRRIDPQTLRGTPTSSALPGDISFHETGELPLPDLGRGSERAPRETR